MKAYIKNIAYYLPENTEENDRTSRLTQKTGIYRRHIAKENETAADLAFVAAEKIFAQGVNKEEIDLLVLCTESPDYILPPTSCILQDRLGLPISCGAFDFNLGCSGYIYGLSIAKGFIESGQAKKVLFVTAETYSKYIHSSDHTARPLFGDAASATLIVGMDTEKAGIRGVSWGTDGSGYDKLIVKVGASRYPHAKTEIREERDKYNNVRTNTNLYMSGSDILSFTLERVPECINNVLRKAEIKKESVDYYVFHQANQFMLEFLRKKCNLPEASYWNDVAEYGNTVSNSIPIALVDMLEENRNKSLINVMIMGFGVGLSWGGCMIDLSEIFSGR